MAHSRQSLNVKGARKYPKIREDLHCHIKNTGAFVVACGHEEEKLLDVLAEGQSVGISLMNFLVEMRHVL